MKINFSNIVKITYIVFLIIIKNINGQWYFLNPLPQGNIIDRILFIDNQKGFLLCGNNLQKTRNGGETWESITFEHFYGPMKIFFLNDENGWLTISDAGKGSLYNTKDSGENWEKLNIPEDIMTNFEMITDVFFTSEYVGYITTDAGKIYYTNDGGNYWLSQFSSLQRKDINSIYFLTENVGFAVGQTPLLVTNDGGKNWLIDSTMLGNNFGLEASKIHFVDSLFGYILSFNSIYITKDAGITWKNYIVENEIYNSQKDDFI
ncbi:MAG: hypothetical protein IPM32_00005, partial [Ignavibacteriae bacterium]|nr:hypothetical protein [Ignavibacteriota bacterium]